MFLGNLKGLLNLDYLDDILQKSENTNLLIVYLTDELPE